MKDGFKSLIAWQKSYYFALDIYRETQAFPSSERYGLISQLRRAVVSVPANISEGYERGCRKEYVRFLLISKGSLGEIETHLLLSKDLQYINSDNYDALEAKRKEIAKILSGLIKSLTK